mmetsp:Transcript_43569/g.100363  ORF Transcript_43569/g.100363 Transcript_43569/m.100363 type:complete len:232 (+) Transcript_43569:508-1203(+)
MASLSRLSCMEAVDRPFLQPPSTPATELEQEAGSDLHKSADAPGCNTPRSFGVSDGAAFTTALSSSWTCGRNNRSSLRSKSVLPRRPSISLRSFVSSSARLWAKLAAPLRLRSISANPLLLPRSALALGLSDFWFASSRSILHCCWYALAALSSERSSANFASKCACSLTVATCTARSSLWRSTTSFSHGESCELLVIITSSMLRCKVSTRIFSMCMRCRNSALSSINLRT